MASPIRVLLDCDPGHDDALAMLVASALSEIDLRGITTVAGNHALDRITDNALRVCALGHMRGVPVAAGASRPLVGDAHPAESIHGESGLDGAELPPPIGPIDPRSALELMTDVAGEGRFTLVATGPLTNVAHALPLIADSLDRVVLMGGATGLGNWTPTAEFNIWCDPEAADAVFSSGVPIEMIGLEVTHQALATEDVRERIRAIGPLGQTVDGLLGFFADAYRDVFGFAAPPVHDVVAVVRLVRPDLVPAVARFVAIETEGRYTRGTTVVDVHGRLGREPNALVATGIDVTAFWDLVITALERVERRT